MTGYTFFFSIIYLPVILIDDGMHVFSSKHILETGSYADYHIAPKGAKNEGKIVRADGSRPFDISITKNVLQLMINAILLLVIVLLCARWYRRHDVLKEHPSGIAALMEPLIMMIHDMARENIGEDDFRRYSPYLLTAFLFILLSNVMGIIPCFPGGANLTGNIACTLVLALFTFFTVNLTGTRHYYKEIFSPDAPGVLKPLMSDIPLNKVHEFEKLFLERMRSSHKDVLGELSSGKIDEGIETILTKVASAKLRKAQQAVEGMRPYTEALSKMLERVVCPVATGEGQESPVATNTVTAIVAVASNSSLCGAFNINVIHKVEETVSQLKAAGQAVEVISVGRKMAEAMRKAGFPSDDYSDLVGGLSNDSRYSCERRIPAEGVSYVDSQERGNRYLLRQRHFGSAPS